MDFGLILVADSYQEIVSDRFELPFLSVAQ